MFLSNFGGKIKTFFKNFYIFIVIAIIYIPMIFILILSFTGQSDRGNIDINFGQATGSNYLKLFADNHFLNVFFNSFIVMIIVAPISLGIAIFACIGMWYAKQKTKQIVLAASKTNIALPDIVTGIMLALLFASTWVAIGFNLGFITVVLAHISFCTPYAIIAIYPKITKMNANLVNVSMDLGYSRLATYFKFVIPYLKGAIITAAILVITISFDDFIITTLVNGNFDTVGTAIFESRKGIKAWIVTFGAILVLVLILVVIVVSIYQIKKEKRSLNAKKNK